MPKHETAAHAAAVGHEVCLGKLEPKRDEHDLQLRDFYNRRRVERQLPTRSWWAKGIETFDMYGNDDLPDCTCATVGHAETVLSHAAGRDERPDLGSVLEMFDATGPRNEGRYCNDILNYWKNVGFGPDREKILAYAAIDPKDRFEVELGIWLFGGLYLGIALPISAQRQERWSVVNDSSGEPGSWGGHAVWAPAFTKMRGVTCITWSRRMQMTWGFIRKHVDEAFVVISPDWVSGDRKAPSGVNLNGLLEQASQFGG